MIRAALSLGVAAAIASFAVAEALRRGAGTLGFTDEPNERSLHAAPTPRAGGLGFAVSVPLLTTIGLQLVNGRIERAEGVVLVAAAALALVGLADDRWHLPAAVRFAAHVAAAGAVVATAGAISRVALPGVFDLPFGAFGIPLTLLWIVALTNIYNFMDGIDGLAAVQAIIAAATLAFLSACLGDQRLALAFTVLGGGVIGFLVLNRPPARIFMGDVGSTFLGFLLAAWSAVGTTRSSRVPVLAAVGVLSPFLFDSVVTLLRRLVRGERIAQAHKSHMYQRLVARGWTHGRTTSLYGALAAIAGVIVILTWCSPRPSGGYFFAALAMPAIIPLVLRRASRATR